MWIRYQFCVNCGTTQRPHKGKGFCSKCYGPAMQLEEIQKWDQSRPETLKRYPGDADSDTKKEFELLREGYKIELQRRLDMLKRREELKIEPISGLQLEYQLDRIARYSGTKSTHLFHGSAGYIELKFPPANRKVLYNLLSRIEEDIAWRGVDLSRVFKYRSDRR